jgi:hypothetical protein
MTTPRGWPAGRARAVTECVCCVAGCQAPHTRARPMSVADGLTGQAPLDASEEDAMIAAAIKLSLEQAASDAMAEPGDPAVAPTARLLGLFAAAATAAAVDAGETQAATPLLHLLQAAPEGSASEEAQPPVELEQVCIGSDASYYYYGAAGEADRGWGCAYRCAQMIVSSIVLMPQVCSIAADATVAERQHVPSIEGIQRVLAGLDECAFGPDKIGSTTWIEPPDVAAYLLARHRVQSVQSEVSLSDRPALVALCRELWTHFRDGSSAVDRPSAWTPPVMVDDATFAYCVAVKTLHYQIILR